MAGFGGDWRKSFYFGFLVSGAGCLTLLLAALLSSKTRRNPTLISLCWSWWISAFPCLGLLFYAGRVTGPSPSSSLCLASATLTMAQAPLTSMSVLCLICHVWFIVRNTMRTSTVGPVTSPVVTTLLVLLPYVAFVAFSVAALALGRSHPSHVHRALFYCVIKHGPFERAIAAFGSIVMLSAIVLEIWIALLVRSNRSNMIRQGVNVTLLMRVLLFGGYVILGFCLNIVSLFNWISPIPDLFCSTCGLAVFFIFGSAEPVWRLCRRLSSRDQSQQQKTSDGSPDRPPVNDTLLFTVPHVSDDTISITSATAAKSSNSCGVNGRSSLHAVVEVPAGLVHSRSLSLRRDEYPLHAWITDTSALDIYK